MSDLTPVEQAIVDAIDWDRGYLDDRERLLLARDIEAAARPLIERELREQIAAEIEADTIPADLLACDHDDQLTAIRRWDAFVARGTCQDCDGTGVDKYDDEPCSTCAGRGTWGGASDGQ